MEQTQFWVAGKYVCGEVPKVVWEFLGLFSTKERAVSACVMRNDFIGPVELDVALPQETVEWVGLEFPLAELSE